MMIFKRITTRKQNGNLFPIVIKKIPGYFSGKYRTSLGGEGALNDFRPLVLPPPNRRLLL